VLYAYEVNTRCIYHRLKPTLSDPDNLTLCPILDFANHANADQSCMTPQPTKFDHVPNRNIGTSLTFISPSRTALEEGQEFYLTYGAHCNRILFVEYGFVDVDHSAKEWQPTRGQVDLQDLMLELFMRPGVSSELRDILTEEGYWG
jgi:hypothetical protein